MIAADTAISIEQVAKVLVSTDFLIERGSKRIALECKFNIHRDFEKTRIIAEIIRDRLHCDAVFIVVPFLQESDVDLLKVGGISLIADQDLIKALHSLIADTK